MNVENKSLEEEVLRKFLTPQEKPLINNQKEKQVFLDLQRHDLIRADVRGHFKATSRGEYALGVGVQRLLATERLEKKLIKDSMKTKVRRRWLILTFCFLLLSLLFLAVSIA